MTYNEKISFRINLIDEAITLLLHRGVNFPSGAIKRCIEAENYEAAEGIKRAFDRRNKLINAPKFNRGGTIGLKNKSCK